MIGEILPRSFYNRSATTVAREVLGRILRHADTAGVIVEAEAYLGLEDRAAHASRGLTKRTEVIFGPPGYAYVYLIYGMYECLNLVTEPEGIPGCVLLRAVEPLAGKELMATRRPKAKTPYELASGPGRLTRALGIGRALNGADLTAGPLTLHRGREIPREQVVVSPRIGIRHCADWPLRFYVQGNSYVSCIAD